MNILAVTRIAKPPMTERAQMFISKVLEESALLRGLNNFGLGATDHVYRPSAGSQSLAARALSAAYTPAAMTRDALLNGPLKIHGFEITYDTSYERDHQLGIGVDVNPWLEQQLTDKAITTADGIESLIISGSGSGDNIKGLKTLLDGSTNVPGLGITCVINAKVTGDSFDLSNAANHDLFMEQFEKWKREVKGASAIILNASLAARLTTIAKKHHAYTTTMNDFGVQVERIDGIELIVVDDSVITNTEPNDNGTPVNDTTSMYILRNAEGHWTIRTNSGLAVWDKDEIEDKPSSMFRFEITGFNEIKTKYAIRRVRNIKL